MPVGVWIKDGVRIDPLTPALARLIAVVDDCARTLGRSLTITCGREGHPADDPHSRGAALDLRSSGLPDAILLTLHQQLRDRLGSAFTVLYEVKTKPAGVLGSIAYVNPDATAAHLHLQVRKGTEWP